MNLFNLNNNTYDELKKIAKYYKISTNDLNKSLLIEKIKGVLIENSIKNLPAYKAIMKKGYLLEWTLDPNVMEDLCCICNPDLISPSYEKLAYGLVDHENNIFGLFIKDENENVVVTCVVDLGCTNVCQKLSIDQSMVENYGEITLLCSNPKHRISGLASLVLNIVKDISLLIDKKYLLLITSNLNKNQSAVSFYKKNGFITTSIPDIMVYGPDLEPAN